MISEVGTAAGWTIFRDDEVDRYFVRLEQVVSLLSNSRAATDLLSAMLRFDGEGDSG